MNILRGVSFQPGTSSTQDPTARIVGKRAGVQEAIKVLSLHLPRVVGAQALAPSPLLNAQGSGGNPRVDSVVNQVWRRMFPTGDPSSGAPAAPMIPPRVVGPGPGESGTMPVSPPVRFDGGQPSPMLRDLIRPEPHWRPAPGPTAPRITPGDTDRGAPMPDRPEWAALGAGFGSDSSSDAPAMGPTGNSFDDLFEYLRRAAAPMPEPQQMYER